MKTFKSFIAVITCIFYMSCQKDSAFLSNDSVNNNVSSEVSTISIPTEELLSLTTITFCSPKVVPLCAGQTIDMGTVTVKTGADNNIYVTYQTKGNWFLKELHLYVGDEAGIPTTSDGNPIPGQFPYTKIFLLPFLMQEYTFIVPNMPTAVTVAAHAVVVKLSLGNSFIIDQQTAWGDGCSGTPINGSASGNWGTKFTYFKGNCEPPDICSKPVNYFFDSTLNGVDIPWIDVNALGDYNGHVTVGGYNYTEAEGRAIYDAFPAGTSDARDGFIQVATLKLSSTNYAQDVELLAAVTTIETWLLTRGKLSTYNLISNNLAVKNAANYIDFWISRHTCADRR